jgi:hypothetical protein
MSQMLNYSIVVGQVFCSKTKKVERQEFAFSGKYIRQCDTSWTLQDGACTGKHYIIHKGEEL